MFEPIMPGAKACALTNFLQLDESPIEAARKMLDFLSAQQTPWQPDMVELDNFQTKKAAIPKHINDLKRQLAKEVGSGVTAESIPFFQDPTNKKRYYFLRPCTNKGLITPSQAVDAKSVLRLAGIAALLGHTEFGSRNLKAFMIGPDIYVGARIFTTKKQYDVVEAFRLELKTSTHNQLQVVLVAQSFKSEDNAIISGEVASSGEDDQGLTLSLIQGERLIKLDGRKSKLPEITFNDRDIRRSRLYLLNRLSEFFSDVYTRAGIAHTRVVFEPTHVTAEPHLRLEAISKVSRELSIVNNTGVQLSVSDQSALIDTLSSDQVLFDAYKFYNDGQPTRDAAWVDELSPADAWLVLNKASDDDNDSSILVENESLKRPWDAYHALANGMATKEDVDSYTWAKFSKLYRQGGGTAAIDIPVMQGIDITSSDTIDVAEKRDALRRCAVELAIKHCYAVGSIPLSPLTPEGKFTLLFLNRVRLQETGAYRKALDYLALVRIVIANGELTIVDSDFYPEVEWEQKEKLQSRFPCLRTFQSDSMYVVDESSGRYLRRYAGNFVPKIILNNRYPSIDDALATIAENDGLLTSGYYRRSSDSALLPFYLPPAEKVSPNVKWRDSSFVEDKGKFVRYFVPSQLSVQSSCGFSNLHDLMVYAPTDVGEEGKISYTEVEGNLLEEPLVQLYLSTLTTGILRLRENSKASLLEKLASLAGMDT